MSFPSNPANNETYTNALNTTWRFDAARNVWLVISEEQAVVDATYFSLSDGEKYVEGAITQTETAGVPGLTASLGDTITGGNLNLVVGQSNLSLRMVGNSGNVGSTATLLGIGESSQIALVTVGTGSSIVMVSENISIQRGNASLDMQSNTITLKGSSTIHQTIDNSTIHQSVNSNTVDVSANGIDISNNGVSTTRISVLSAEDLTLTSTLGNVIATGKNQVNLTTEGGTSSAIALNNAESITLATVNTTGSFITISAYGQLSSINLTQAKKINLTCSSGTTGDGIDLTSNIAVTVPSCNIVFPVSTSLTETFIGPNNQGDVNYLGIQGHVGVKLLNYSANKLLYTDNLSKIQESAVHTNGVYTDIQGALRLSATSVITALGGTITVDAAIYSSLSWRPAGGYADSTLNVSLSNGAQGSVFQAFNCDAGSYSISMNGISTISNEGGVNFMYDNSSWKKI